MGHFRIRASGGGSVGEIGNLAISSFQIEDMSTNMIQNYLFGGGGGGVSVAPVGGAVVSSWSEFDANCGLGGFSGWVTLASVSGVKTQSQMSWNDGRFPPVDTSGWEISIPGGSVVTGYLTKVGKPGRESSLGLEGRWITLAVWHPLYQRTQRDNHLYAWANMWGQLDLNIRDWSGIAAGGASSSTWEYTWIPLNPSRKLPPELTVQGKGKWYADGGIGKATSGPLDFNLTGVGAFLESDTITVRSNDMLNLLGGCPSSADSNGDLACGAARYPIVWMVTAFKLIPR